MEKTQSSITVSLMSPSTILNISEYEKQSICMIILQSQYLNRDALETIFNTFNASQK